MIDFHSHILPGIDDGSEDIETSLEMLKTCQQKGISTVLLTPHCHPMSQFHVDKFAELRDGAYKKLTEAVKKEKIKTPKMVLGAEVRIYDRLHEYKGLEKLCIEGTNYMILEMPYERWKDYAFEEIYRISRMGFRPIMAHLDRFLDQEEFFRDIYSADVLVQMNSTAFFNREKRRTMADFFNSGRLHVIGSDAHDCDDRPPNADSAFEIIRTRFGEEYVDYLEYAGRAILENRNVLPGGYKQISRIKKLFL